jgi:hypothetical protein
MRGAQDVPPRNRRQWTVPDRGRVSKRCPDKDRSLRWLLTAGGGGSTQGDCTGSASVRTTIPPREDAMSTDSDGTTCEWPYCDFDPHTSSWRFSDPLCSGASSMACPASTALRTRSRIAGRMEPLVGRRPSRIGRAQAPIPEVHLPHSVLQNVPQLAPVAAVRDLLVSPSLQFRAQQTASGLPVRPHETH